ncbi:hypothetical protein ABFP37_14360 [Burkholderia sp. RS01]|uniref:hypothetical protein n=1 Tax=unclassified Burkholderia TaxID=2613784 RepID=UPI003218C81C
MAQNNHRAGPASTRPASAQALTAGFSSWTRERKIYLAVGVLASLVGVLLIAFSL